MPGCDRGVGLGHSLSHAVDGGSPVTDDPAGTVQECAESLGPGRHPEQRAIADLTAVSKIRNVAI